METTCNNTKIKRRFMLTKRRFTLTKRRLASLKGRFTATVLNSVVILLLLSVTLASCDKNRQYARKGNHQYNKKNYAKAEENYKQALKKDSTFSAVNYNMGNAIMQDDGKDYAKAVNYYNKYLENAQMKNPKQAKNISKVLYNRGNALFGLSQQDKENEQSMKYLQQAAQDYRQAIMLNPKDTNAKYNYALCMWLLKNNNNPDNNKDNQNNNNNNSEINQMLQAMKNNEKNTISRVKKHQENTQQKNNEKDW